MDFKKLDKAFDNKELPKVNTWSPDKEGSFITGNIINYGRSKDFGTPFVILDIKKDETLYVYIKRGCVGQFIEKGIIASFDDESWKKDLSGQMIAFRYEGMKKEGSSNPFASFKVLFESDLEELGLLQESKSSSKSDESEPKKDKKKKKKDKKKKKKDKKEKKGKKKDKKKD